MDKALSADFILINNTLINPSYVSHITIGPHSEDEDKECRCWVHFSSGEKIIINESVRGMDFILQSHKAYVSKL
jgi:hypothetical protein